MSEMEDKQLNTNARQRDRFAKRRAAGLCARCGKVETNKTRCDLCKNKEDNGVRKESAALRRKKTYAERKLNKRCGDCNDLLNECRVSLNRTRCENCQNKYSGTRLEIKDRAFNAYGGYKCNCCGNAEFKEFMQLDHINNDGAAQRKLHGYRTGDSFYMWLFKHNYPEGIQVLCANCNCAKGILGECPHKTRRLSNERKD